MVFTEGMYNMLNSNVDAYFNYTGYDVRGDISFGKANGGFLVGYELITNICLDNQNTLTEGT